MATASCRCGHTAAQHYRDRKGRPMCAGPCGCTGYQPADPPRAPRVPEHLTGSDRPGGGDPLADYLHLKGEL
ncbi:hypothetical protein QOZ88_05780 [Blastococcus sp. BMG 814]|uniref:Metallothionein n=1 Tax=Blastococcus carthaginiensis TaxID=3050034 RepID=A0ABT9IAE2_9ACTN|nr:hypothetical protein [Blastococcus carthaginiensis]MDP5182139.1 hypothetical protein [Blastococcus carthaginiensis]